MPLKSPQQIKGGMCCFDGQGEGQVEEVERAAREGWAVGVCGWQRREAHGVSDGAGGVAGAAVTCDFLTEFIAPGCGTGKRGAGTRLLAEMKRRCGGGGEGEVHGYIWEGNKGAREWWGRRGMATTWESSGGDGWCDGTGKTRRMYRTKDEDEYGYMRSTWSGLRVGNMGEPWAEGAAAEHGRMLFKEYETWGDLKKDAAVYRAVRAAIKATHQEDGMTLGDITKETAAQRAEGRIRYMVGVEQREVNGTGGNERKNTRGPGRRNEHEAGAGGRRGERPGQPTGEGRGDGAEPASATEAGQPEEQGTVVADGRAERVVDRSHLTAAAAERGKVVKEAAAAAGLAVGERLRVIRDEHMFQRWRWGRVPMDGGGWLVTFRHDAAETELLGGGVDMREVRLAVMKSQFGWGAYAVCECRAEERLGWYEGEEVTVDEWEGLGRREGREHTVRVSWERADTMHQWG